MVVSVQVRKDKGCVKEINLIEMDCPNHCGWRGLLVQFEVEFSRK